MTVWFSSGHAVDLVLVVILLEFAYLNLRRRGGLRTTTWLDRALALLPGALILLALRAALTGAPWPWIAGLLAASFPIHLWDVVRRRL